MIVRMLAGLAVMGVLVTAFATPASAATPGAVVVVAQQGVTFFPPSQVGVHTPPPVIVVNGVLKGFHAP